jgi:hypothetical protein
MLALYPPYESNQVPRLINTSGGESLKRTSTLTGGYRPRLCENVLEQV